MTTTTTINTDKAPAAIGTYSQAVKVGNTVYLSYSGECAYRFQPAQTAYGFNGEESEDPG